MKEALYYKKLKNSGVICCLCPHNCRINEGKRGICRVRKNINGELYTEVYGKVVAMNVDPVEKKPLFHFYPGMQVLSIGTVGCNLKCSFCQNCEISQAGVSEHPIIPEISHEQMIRIAMEKTKNIGIAFTYNEPVIYFEYMIDLARKFKEKGMKTIMVSNGFINPEPLADLLECIDAFNIDLKAFNEAFYKIHTHSELGPVLNTIKSISKRGKHLEITFLVIPGLNDDPVEFNRMVQWIESETGPKTVLHISRYFPRYKMTLPPTPFKTLETFYHMARKRLFHVYTGNVSETTGQHTVCPNCKSILITRKAYYTFAEGISKDGHCLKCNEKVISCYTP